MKIKMYNELPEDAISIRRQVFMEEQGFEDEFDEIDKSATHILIYEGDRAIATGRFFYSEAKKCYVLGRIAVLKEYRGNNYGGIILKSAETKICKMGYHMVCLLAQVRAMEFYRKCGYVEQGEICLNEGCPHIWMYKKLRDNE